MGGCWLGSALPIVAAPMAGGPTTAESAAAAARAGAFPFLAAGYKSPAAVADEIARLRAVTDLFGVNLFVPSTDPVDATALRAYAQALQPEAERLGVALDADPVVDDDGWPRKLDLLLRDPVPVVSLTFGLPAAADIAALQAVGTRVLASVTTACEATAAGAAGADGLIVQGPGAGGHSATFDPRRPIASTPTEDVVREVRAVSTLPLVAGGGVDGPAAVRHLLDAGSDAVAVGTVLLLADEAGTSATYRAALRDRRFTTTTVTHAFTGRPARALRNRFVERYESSAPFAYPAVHRLTRAMRQAAAAAGDPDTLHLWAGTGWRSAPTGPVADIVRWLAADL